MRKLVGGSLAWFHQGPVAGLVFDPTTRSRKARARILRRRRAHIRWLRQQVAFQQADSQYKYTSFCARNIWRQLGKRKGWTSYHAFMSHNISRLLQGLPIEMLPPGYTCPPPVTLHPLVYTFPEGLVPRARPWPLWPRLDPAP